MPPVALPESLMDPSHVTHQANTEPIPGYRLIEPLGRGGFGEVWKCEAPGGFLKAIKFVQGSVHALDSSAPADEELRAIQRVKAIRHPFILSIERLETLGCELVIVLELADKNLHDVLRAEQQAGRPGIRRDVLLGYLREAAEALDLMNARHDLQHLDIKPQNLFLVSNHVKVGDFGLVSSLTGAGSAAGLPALQVGAITPLYASPEVFQGTISRHSDQYSLAIVYQELLTGVLPFQGKNSRQLLMQHLQGQPDLSPLRDFDRPVVARALAKNPADRFPSCSDFIHALEAGQTEVISTTVPVIRTDDRRSAHPTRPGGETRKIPAPKTVKTATLPRRSLGTDRFPGLELLDLVSRSPLTEVWKARANDGSYRLVKVIFGLTAQSEEGVARLTRLRHPALVPFEVLDQARGRLVLSAPAPKESLREVLQGAQSDGFAGLPRAEALAYLRTAAETLDSLARNEGLFHLTLNPRNLVLDNDQFRLADFGLAQLVWLPSGQSVAQVNARYSAPELAARRAGPACDQYSLALIYHELLTGSLPAPLPPTAAAPSQLNFDKLPEADRATLAKALDPVAEHRFGSCLDLIQALEAVSATSAVPTSAPARVHPADAEPSARAAGRQAVLAPRRSAAASADMLQTRFGTTLTSNVIRERLEGFRQQWKATEVSAEGDQFVFQMQTPRSFWQRWTGRQPGLAIHIQLATHDPESGTSAGQVRTEVRVDIRPHDCGREQSGELLTVVGPLLVESVRTYLQVNPRGRAHERLVWHHPVQVCSIGADGIVGPPIECHGKDISLNGIGFYLPGQLPSSQVILHLPKTPQTPQMTVPARIIRVQGCGDGWYEVGAMLHANQEDA